MQARLRHLEHLVHVLKAQARENSTASSSGGALDDECSEDDLFGACPRMGEALDMIRNDDKFTSDAAKWETVLREVCRLSYLRCVTPEIKDLIRSRRLPRSPRLPRTSRPKPLARKQQQQQPASKGLPSSPYQASTGQRC